MLTKDTLMGTANRKGVLERSGILVAIFVTLRIILSGAISGNGGPLSGIGSALVLEWDTISTLWMAAILVLVNNESRK